MPRPLLLTASDDFTSTPPASLPGRVAPGLRSTVARQDQRSRAARRRHVDAISALPDADLLARVAGAPAGSPWVERAAEALRSGIDIAALADLGPAAIASALGMSMSQSERIAAGLELGRRARIAQLRERAPIVACAADVVAELGVVLGGLGHEEMWVLSLDGRQRIRGRRRVAQGGLHGCAVTARDILRAALADAASAFVLVHNHPSGDPTPSVEDLAMTRAVAQAGAVVGVPLCDHVVIAGARHASLLELGGID